MHLNKVIINCRSKNTVHPELLKSLFKQSASVDIFFDESEKHPTRLQHIQDLNTLYFILDEDVSLPNDDFILRIRSEFEDNPDMLFLAGGYINPENASYLTRCYNNLIRLWMKIESSKCQNAPGGLWVVSGRLLPVLVNWKEPDFWAGEDTYSIRYLQSQGVRIFHRSHADVYHHSKVSFFYFIRRAWKQGWSKSRYQLESSFYPIRWDWVLQNWMNWPGWALHQSFVFLGSILSKIASPTPKSSPSA